MPINDDDRAKYIVTIYAVYAKHNCGNKNEDMITDPLKLYTEKYWRRYKREITKLDKLVAITEVLDAMLKPKSYIGCLVYSHVNVTPELRAALRIFIADKIEIFPEVC